MLKYSIFKFTVFMNHKQIENLTKAKNHALIRGGLCLSEEYKNNKEKLTWKCSNEQHPEWQSNYDNVLNKNTWCIHCSGKNKKESTLGIKEAHNHAQSKGGKCLSLTYESRQKKLEWKCHNPNHKSWLAPTDLVIYRNTWCPECGFTHQKELRKDNLGLEKAKAYAQSKGGVCLSTEYVNQNTNLEWKCSNENHSSWFALPKIVTRETWCIHCSRERKSIKD